MDNTARIDPEAEFRRAVADYYGVTFYDVLIRGDRVQVNKVPYVNEARAAVVAALAVQ